MMSTLKLIISSLILILVKTKNELNAIKCYNCIADPHTQQGPESKRLYSCSEFDFSEKYQIDCPYSTFCLKQVQSLALQHVTVNLTNRGCATQKSKTPTYLNDSWTEVIKIEQLFNAGCYDSFVKDNRLTDRINCYCETDFCNYSSTISNQQILLILFCFILVICFC